MEPTLVAGQGLIGWRDRRARVGQLRVVEHPRRPGMWLVKRVEQVETNRMSVRSDNRALDTVDSTTFGAVDVDGSYRVVAKVPLRWM